MRSVKEALCDINLLYDADVTWGGWVPNVSSEAAYVVRTATHRSLKGGWNLLK